MTYSVACLCYRFENETEALMEPIVIIGLIAVGYAGVVSVQDLLRDLGITLPKRARTAAAVRTQIRSHALQTQVKQVAGMHI